MEILSLELGQEGSENIGYTPPRILSTTRAGAVSVKVYTAIKTKAPAWKLYLLPAGVWLRSHVLRILGGVILIFRCGLHSLG